MDQDDPPVQINPMERLGETSEGIRIQKNKSRELNRKFLLVDFQKMHWIHLVVTVFPGR